MHKNWLDFHQGANSMCSEFRLEIALDGIGAVVVPELREWRKYYSMIHFNKFLKKIRKNNPWTLVCMKLQNFIGVRNCVEMYTI